MNLNKSLVAAGFFLLVLGAAILLMPSLSDEPIVAKGASLPTSVVLILLGVISIFGSRFNKIKAPGVEIDAEPESPVIVVQSQPEVPGAKPGEPITKLEGPKS